MTKIEELVEKIPLARGAKIAAWHPCGLVAINKKAGIKSHPNSNGSREVAAVMARYNFNREYYSWEDEGEKDKKYHLHLINRLDSPTSGVILAAFSARVAAAARLAFKEKKGVKKFYKAVVIRNKHMPPDGMWRDYVTERNIGGALRACISNHGSRAETRYSLDGLGDNNQKLALINLEPATGLTHQLRVQCKARNIPILGDGTYGEFAANKKIKKLLGLDRMFLHCAKISLDIEIESERIVFEAEAPVPESFAMAMSLRQESAI